MAYDLIGKNFTPPDIYGKVTGKAKYAEDFRADGMVFCRLLTSPMPHAKVKKIDTTAALSSRACLASSPPTTCRRFPPPNNPILTNEPLYVGDPILAVAAETEQLTQDAIDLIKIDYEPLPFVVDPLDSLHPAGPDRAARRQCGQSAGQVPDHKVDRARLRGRRRGQPAHGQTRRGVDLWGPRSRVQRSQARPRRELRHRRPGPPLHGAPAPPWRIGRTARSSCSAQARARPR